MDPLSWRASRGNNSPLRQPRRADQPQEKAHEIVLRTPKSMLARKRVKKKAATSPMATPATTSESLAQNHPQHDQARCAERHAEADFTRPSGNRKR